MKAKEYEIIIPIGLKDTGFVWRVVKYIRKSMPEAAHIYLITSKKNFKLLKKVKDEDYSILDENELIDGLTFQQTARCLSEAHITMRTGWYFQHPEQYEYNVKHLLDEEQQGHQTGVSFLVEMYDQLRK